MPRIPIENVRVNELFDTGAEISCVSEDFYNHNLRIFREAPRLPVTRKVASGAFGDKNNKVKIQTMESVTIESHKNDLIFFVIPKLIRDYMLGHDSLETLRVLIDPEEKKIIFKDNNQKIYKTANFEQKSCEEHSINLVEDFQCTTINDFEISEIKEYKYLDKATFFEINEILKEEIWGKICSQEDLNTEQKRELFELINSYKEAFNKNLGRVDTYEHSFKLKRDKPVMIKNTQYNIESEFKLRCKECWIWELFDTQKAILLTQL